MWKMLWNTVCIVLALWIFLAAPTGWLYDLQAGTGTAQGQRPDETVVRLREGEAVEDLFLAQTPVTITGQALVACPLARLRDPEQAGQHYASGGRKRFWVDEYTTSPLTRSLLKSWYNGYYLQKLDDDSYLCVYFDDYLAAALALGREVEMPTGYLRYTTLDERKMLNLMAAEYPVDPIYVLDLYRYGKAGWVADMALRVGVLIAALGIGALLQTLWEKLQEKKKRRKEPQA